MFLLATCTRSLRHGDGLSACVGGLEELAQTALPFLEGLVRRRLGHLQDGSPQVELVGDVGTDGTNEEQEEIGRVAEDWTKGTLVTLDHTKRAHKNKLTGNDLVPTQGDQQAVEV